MGADVDIVPLYGMLDARTQDAAIRPAPEGRRKIVLATSIAETSITIDGVRVVVDSGLSRLPKFEPATGLTRLETVRVSRASADQRAGRAGRTQPGVAIRLWRAEQTAALPAFTPPEILEADLSGLVLDCAAFGVADPSTLAFLDPPPGPALAEAKTLLLELDAITAEGRITEGGMAMRKLALPVRLAHMVAEAANSGHAAQAAKLAVLMTERGLGGDSVDLDRRLTRFDSERSPRAIAARQLAERLARVAFPSPLRGGSDQKRGMGVPGDEVPAFPPPPRSASRIDPPHKGEGKGAGAFLLNAWPDRVAKARGERGRFLLANGRGAMIDEADPLAAAPYLVVADLQGKAQNARIASAAVVWEEDIRTVLASHIQKATESAFDVEKRAVRVRETIRLGAILLSERMLPAPAGAEADHAVIEAVRKYGLRYCYGARTRKRFANGCHGFIGALGPLGPMSRRKRSPTHWKTGFCPFLAARHRLPGWTAVRCRKALRRWYPTIYSARLRPWRRLISTRPPAAMCRSVTRAIGRFSRSACRSCSALGIIRQSRAALSH